VNDATDRTLVWDLPTRVFHWTLAAMFAAAWLTADSERLRDLHMLLGYTAAGLVAFRLVWGVVGTRYARFASFPLAPSAAVRYLKSLLSTSPQHHFGHNPAGSWAVVGLLALIASTALSGWAHAMELGPKWLEDVHEGFANATLALVSVHIAAVLVSSVLHRENLVRAMITGFKPGRGPAAAGPRWFVALLLVAAIGAFWSGAIPAPGLEGKSRVQAGVRATGKREVRRELAGRREHAERRERRRGHDDD
jgi:cytochrome b